MRKQASHPSGDERQANDDDTSHSHSSHPSGDGKQAVYNEKYPSDDRKQTFDDENQPYEYESVAYEKPEDEINLK